MLWLPSTRFCLSWLNKCIELPTTLSVDHYQKVCWLLFTPFLSFFLFPLSVLSIHLHHLFSHLLLHLYSLACWNIASFTCWHSPTSQGHCKEIWTVIHWWTALQLELLIQNKFSHKVIFYLIMIGMVTEHQILLMIDIQLWPYHAIQYIYIYLFIYIYMSQRQDNVLRCNLLFGLIGRFVLLNYFISFCF